MSDAQERANEGVAIATAPLRATRSMGEAALVLLGLVAFGLGYPIYLLCSGQSVTAGSVAGSALTMLAIFTFFYAPWYVVNGGILLGAISWVWMIVEGAIPAIFDGWGFAICVSIFLCIGILQRYLRQEASEPAIADGDLIVRGIEEQFREGHGGMSQLQWNTRMILRPEVSPLDWEEDREK